MDWEPRLCEAQVSCGWPDAGRRTAWGPSLHGGLPSTTRHQCAPACLLSAAASANATKKSFALELQQVATNSSGAAGGNGTAGGGGGAKGAKGSGGKDGMAKRDFPFLGMPADNDWVL